MDQSSTTVDRFLARVQRWLEYFFIGLLVAGILLAVVLVNHPNSEAIFKHLDQAACACAELPKDPAQIQLEAAVDKLTASVRQLTEERKQAQKPAKPYDPKTDELGKSIRKMNEEYDELSAEAYARAVRAAGSYRVAH